MAVAAFWALAAAAKPYPPGQPTSGPGGSDYPHASFTEQRVEFDRVACWVFTPADPAAAAAPVVVFLPGWGATDPTPYRAWLAHLARRGCIVFYVGYQPGLETPPAQLTAHALRGILGLFGRAGGTTTGAPPAPDRYLIVGHSVGGLLAMNLAAELPRHGFARPRAVVSFFPGKTWGETTGRIPLTDLSVLRPPTRLVVVTGDADHRTGDFDARLILRTTTGLPPPDKTWVILRSDRHGAPALVADHFAVGATEIVAPPADRDPAAARLRRQLAEQRARRLHPMLDANSALHLDRSDGIVDTLDYRGSWRIVDATAASVLADGDERAIATVIPLEMGRWSDGQPVAPLSLRPLP